MAVRSNYIKSLMESKNSLEKQYQEVVAESMKNIIGENAKDEVRKLLKEAEDEDSFSEEDVDDDTATNDEKGTEVDIETTTEDNPDDESDEEVDTIDDLEDSEEDTEDEDTVDNIWDDLEWVLKMVSVSCLMVTVLLKLKLMVI